MIGTRTLHVAHLYWGADSPISRIISLWFYIFMQIFCSPVLLILGTCTWLAEVPLKFIFETRNGMIGYVPGSEPLPLWRHTGLVLFEITTSVRVMCTPDDFLLSCSKQPPEIYSSANNYYMIAWIIHFDQFWHQGIQKKQQEKKKHASERGKKYRILTTVILTWNYIRMEPTRRSVNFSSPWPYINRTNEKWKYLGKPYPLGSSPVSILRKSISGRHRPVRVADGPMTARCRFT